MSATRSKLKENDKEKIKRIKYDRSKIKDALYAVKHKTMGIREASRVFKIPRTTLQDRIHGRIDEQCLKVGRETVLNEKEEEVLVQWLIQLSKCGFPRKRSDLINTVSQIVKEDGRPNSFKDGRPGAKWYNLFMKRHPILSERTPEALGQARATVTEEYIRSWFQGLTSYLRETGNEDILHDPCRILNGDETSFSICPKSGKVIGPKGWKNIYEITKGSEKETITVLLVISASGESIPPMVVFPYIRRPPKEIVDNAPSHWFIGISDSGWMRSGLFFEYIANGVFKWVTEKNIQKPILLLVDGHKSHLTKDLSIFCKENGIILYALPPNTTHIMQPADVSVFRPLKHQWRKTVKEWQENSHRTLNKITFCPLLSETLKNLTTDTIKNGFKKCGLYPFSPEAVDYTKYVRNIQENTLSNEINRIGENISQSDLETTLKVLKICRGELKNSGIDIEMIEKIITHKKENKFCTSYLKRHNEPEENLKKKKEPLIMLEDNVFNTSDKSVDSISILEAPERIIQNQSTVINENVKPYLTSTLHYELPDANQIQNRSSTPDISSPELTTVSAQIHLNDCDKSIPTSTALKSHNLNDLIKETRSKDMQTLNNSLLDNIDIASDFDFSLPGSPSASRVMPLHSPLVDISNISQICSRPSSNTSSPTSRYTISPAFKKHLFAPKSLHFGNKRKPKGEEMPLAVSSEKWRLYMKEKDNEKEKLLKQREERKKRIEINKAEKARKKIELAERRKNKKELQRRRIQITILVFLEFKSKL